MSISAAEKDNQTHDLNSLIDGAVNSEPKPVVFLDNTADVPVENNTSNQSFTSPPSSEEYIDDEPSGNFNADIHSVDENGKPRYNKNGTYRKKRGRKSGVHNHGNNGVYVDDALCQKAAVAIVNTIIAAGLMIGGEEWVPKPEESLMLNQGWYEYFKAAGIINVPPWVTLVAINAMYIMPRLNMPKTKSKIDMLLGGRKVVKAKVDINPTIKPVEGVK